MIIFKNNFKCFSRLKFNFNLFSTQAFRFSTDPPQENQEKAKVQPKIIQKISKFDLKKHVENPEHQERTEKQERVESSQETSLVEGNIREKRSRKRGRGNKKSRAERIEEKKQKLEDLHSGEVKPYFLNKMDENELDYKTFSIAKLMEYNSSERRSKIKHLETTLMLNKDLTQSMSKTELKKKLTEIKDELVRELPRNL
jgi:hypothetical protein